MPLYDAYPKRWCKTIKIRVQYNLFPQYQRSRVLNRYGMSVCVCVSVCVYSGYIIHHYNGIWGTCAPGRRNMHHQGAICTMVHKGDYVFFKIHFVMSCDVTLRWDVMMLFDFIGQENWPVGHDTGGHVNAQAFSCCDLNYFKPFTGLHLLKV